MQNLILGTVQLGIHYGINNKTGKPDKEQVFDILNLARKNGIVQLDSADAYGDAQKMIGRYIRSTGNLFLVNTKFRLDHQLSIEDQLGHTLQELSLQKANVYFYHRFQEMKDNPQSLEVLTDLKKKEKINKVGVSVYSNEELSACIEERAIDVIQIPFNLLDNYSLRGLSIQKAKEKHKEIQVRSVFLQGLFFKEANELPEKLRPLSKYLNQLRQIAVTYGVTMQQLALGYALAKPEIDYIIVGVDSREQLMKNIENWQALDKKAEEEIDKIIVQEEALLYPYNW